MIWFARSLVLVVCMAASAHAAPGPEAPPPSDLTEQAIDAADLDGWRVRRDAKAPTDTAPARRGADRTPRDDDPDPFLIRLQILLDRAHASPGVIDGRDGGNLRKAVGAFQAMRGLAVTGDPDPELWDALAGGAMKATRIYEITSEDVNGRYVEKLPEDYAKLAKLKWLGFRGPAEMLAERFHMAEALLRRLNPEADFGAAGQKILVAETGTEPAPKVARIEVDKDRGELRAFGRDGALVLFAPATVGSAETPSPSGEMKVNSAHADPFYKYDPTKNFQQGKNRRKLTLYPGPNGPVGSMWIDLSKPTYGIHGTPEPDKIDKTGSHGCVRLTNWDAVALAALVEPKKTVVTFR